MVVVLDTDPGVDDTLALLYLLSVPKIKHELRLITSTFGNCALEDTLNNVSSLFKVVALENDFRKSENLSLFTDQRPAIHLGESGPLSTNPEQTKDSGEDATDVHGNDGLAGIHDSNPEFDAPQEWFNSFPAGSGNPKKQADVQSSTEQDSLPFIAGQTPSWKAILDLLASEPEDTVTIVAVGPLTNLARAAQEDLKTFLRVKSVCSMGAALEVAGNVTPTAEFNVFADPLAAAQLYSLTSKHPEHVQPPHLALNSLRNAEAAAASTERPLNLVLFPLDITHQHSMQLAEVKTVIGQSLKQHPKSVSAQWVQVWSTRSFSNYGKLIGRGPENAMSNLHDPSTAAYAVLDTDELDGWVVAKRDVRVETLGQWTLGMTVVDQRGRAKQENNAHDRGLWLTRDQGNDVGVLVDTPIKKTFSDLLLERILNY